MIACLGVWIGAIPCLGVSPSWPCKACVPLILGPVRMVEEARKCFVFAPFPTILGVSPPRREIRILLYDGMSSMTHSIPSTRPHRRIRCPLRVNPSPVMARTAEEVRRLRPDLFGHCLQRRGSCYVVVSECYR